MMLHVISLYLSKKKSLHWSHECFSLFLLLGFTCFGSISRLRLFLILFLVHITLLEIWLNYYKHSFKLIFLLCFHFVIKYIFKLLKIAWTRGQLFLDILKIIPSSIWNMNIVYISCLRLSHCWNRICFNFLIIFFHFTRLHSFLLMNMIQYILLFAWLFSLFLNLRYFRV